MTTSTATIIATLNDSITALEGKGTLKAVRTQYMLDDTGLTEEQSKAINCQSTKKRCIEALKEVLAEVLATETEEPAEAPAEEPTEEPTEEQTEATEPDLSAIALSIKEAMQDIQTKSISIGTLLNEARPQFAKQAPFIIWAKETVGLQKAQAFKLMKIAKMFGTSVELQALSVTALYTLTQGTPEEMETVITLIDSGETVTNDMVLEVMGKQKTTAVTEAPEEAEEAGEEAGEEAEEESAELTQEEKKVQKAVQRVEQQKAKIQVKLDETKEQKDALIKEKRDLGAELKASKKAEEKTAHKLEKAEAVIVELRAKLAEALKAKKPAKKTAKKTDKKVIDANAMYNERFTAFKAEGSSPVEAMSKATKVVYMAVNDLENITLKGTGSTAQIKTPIGYIKQADIRKELGLKVIK